MLQLDVNGQHHEVAMEPDTPLLWVLRDGLKLTGTKYSCGIAVCGACVVLVDGEPVRSCVTPASLVTGKSITTIEGLSGDNSHPVQQAWKALDVPQCGYCQAGQMMAAADLISRIPNPTDKDIDLQHTNICRCGTYSRIRKAIHKAARLASGNT